MALLGTVLADLAFIIIGILLILLGRHFPVSIIDKALPFVALAFSLVMFFTSTYTDFNRLVLLTAASIGVLLGICAIYATVRDVVSTGKMPEKYTPQPK